MIRIFKVLQEVSVKLSQTGMFTLYPGDTVTCSKLDIQYSKSGASFEKTIILSVQYKMSDIGFTDKPKHLKELVLKENVDTLFVEKRKQYLLIDNCVKYDIIEDITIEHLRNEKLKELLYEE